MLSWKELLASFGRLLRLSATIALHRKLPFMAAGVICYYAGLYILAILRPGEGFGVSQALFVLVEIPGVVLAIYLTMDQVAGERQQDTLETLFSTAMSHYGVWTARLATVYAALALSLLLMSAAAYFLFAEFPFLAGGLNACAPAFLVGSLTFFLSVFYRSSNTAGMLALAATVGVLLFSSSLQGSVYYLFLNPFSPPLGADLSLWHETVLFNRAGIIALGLGLLFAALRRMRRREKLLS
jgi:hypothetical protein